MKFNEAKCRVLHMDWGNPWYQYRVGDEGTESSPAENDLGVLVDEKLDMTWQYALTAEKANRILGSIKRSVASRFEGGDSAPLVCSGEIPAGVLRPALEPSAQERHGAVGAGPEEATKKIQGLEHLSYKEQAERVGVIQPGEQKALTSTFLQTFST